MSLEEWLWDWLLVLCKQILTGFLLGISPSGRQGKVWLQYQLDKVLANPGGRCGVRTAHQSPRIWRRRPPSTALPWLLSSAGCSGKGVTLSKAALLLRQTLKELGGHLPTPLPVSEQQALP